MLIKVRVIMRNNIRSALSFNLKKKSADMGGDLILKDVEMV